jgi:Fe-S-cluster containining protein
MKIPKEFDSCTCNKCVSMCSRPCWGTPKELKKIIDSGYGEKLMLDYWCKIDGDLYLLCGALVGYEGRSAPYIPFGTCTFLNKDNLCDIYTLRPMEARIASCNPKQKFDAKEYRHSLAKLWQKKEGQQIINDWKKLVNY